MPAVEVASRWRAGGRGGTAALLDRLLAERAIRPVFQPIVELATGRIVGVEALARGPSGTPLESPAGLFSAAVRAGRLSEVDMLCGARALEAARAAGAGTPPLVFINMEPAGADRPLSPDLERAIGPDRSFQIVVEYTERALTRHPAALLRLTDGIRANHDAVALDDVGVEPHSLAMLPLIAPEVVKLDMHLLRTATSAYTIDTAAAVEAYAERSGAIVLCEGVETEHDRRAALALGARWGQGWLFGHPAPLDALDTDRVVRGVRLTDLGAGPGGPDASPVEALAVAGSAGRRGDLAWVTAACDGLVRHAERRTEPPVVLCACDDAPVLAHLAAVLPGLAARVAYLGLIGPAGTPPVGGVETAPSLSAGDPLAGGATTMVVVGPHTARGLWFRRDDDGYDLATTHDPGRVHAIARTLLHRFTA